MRRVTAAVGLGLLVALTAGAQDGPVTIKLKKPGPGVVTRETKAEKATNKITITVGGNDQLKTEGGTSKFVYSEEVVERPAGAKKPTRLKRTYETAELNKGGQAEELGLAGKTVVIEKKGGAYAFTADGRDLTGKAAELLGKEFNKKTDTDEEVYLPKGPVKVGESWKVDVVELAKELSAEGMTIDPAKSSATAKLVRAYDKNGHKYGVIEVKVELTVTKIGGGGMEIPLKGGSKMDVAVVLDGCIDGSEANGESKMTLTGTLTGEVNGVTLKVALRAENTGSSVEVPKR